MPIEHHVVSLELAKQLKGAGYPQEACFYWIEAYENYKITAEAYEGWVVRSKYNAFDKIPEDKKFAAPLASEIGEQLPAMIEGYDFVSKKYRSGWGVGYRWVDESEDKNEANARAMVWLDLKKNGLLAQLIEKEV